MSETAVSNCSCLIALEDVEAIAEYISRDSEFYAS